MAARGGGDAKKHSIALACPGPMEDTQAAFQIMRLPAATRITFPMRTLFPSVTSDAAVEYGGLLEWAPASVVAEEGVEAGELASPNKVHTDHNLCLYQSVLESDTLCQAHFPVQKSRLKLTSSASVAGATCIGCQALALGCTLTTTSTCGLPAPVEHLAERPLVKELISAMREVAKIVTEGQLKNAVGAS